MDNDDLINGFFEGTLSKSEQDAFNILLETDAEFITQFEFEQQLQSSLKKQHRQDIKSMFSKLDIDTVSDSEGGVHKKRETKVIAIRPWLIAASIALLVGISSWLLFFDNGNIDASQLYNANFSPYQNVVHPIERGKQLDDLKTRAFTAYEDGNYNLALELFKELQRKQSDSYIDFYEAIVLMQLNDHDQAIDLLEGYIATNGELKDRATWYLALAYLKQKNIPQSKQLLEELVAKNGFNSEQAKQLLNRLD